MLQRKEAYDLLRRALLEYADEIRAADIEIFGIEMEVAPGSADSMDPALLDEFSKAVPEQLSLRDALLACAAYVETELVQLRKIEAANRIVADFREAANDGKPIPSVVRRIYDDEPIQ